MLLEKELRDFSSEMYLDLIMKFNNDIEFEETNKFSEEEDLRTLDVDQLTNRLEKSLSVSIDKVEKMLDRNLETSDIVRLCHIGIEIANAKCERSNKSLSSTESEDSSPNETQADENTAKTPIQSSIPIDLERRIREMEYSSHTGPPAEIDDNSKRWLVVGICLHSVLAAALRKYVEPVISNLYNSLKLSDQIDKQTYTRHLKIYGAVNFYLNYKTINNNKMPPGNRAPNYDYKVQNAVDLSKLFLETSIAHYKGFDESCDSSALLGIIVNTDKFPANVQIAAKNVRLEIRNRWAHCDFTEWNSGMYNWSLQKIEDFIYLLHLNTPEESQAIRDLNKWKTNGINYLEDTTLGLELVNDIRQQITSIMEVQKVICKSVDREFSSVHTELTEIGKTLNQHDKRISSLENTVITQRKTLMNMMKYGSSYDADIPEIERWRQNSKDFIKTDIFTNISGIIKYNHCVLLTEVSGMGKTMTAHNIALQLCQEEGYSIVACNNVNDIKKRYKDNVRQVFIVDDICGKYTPNIKYIENWTKIKEFVNFILRKGKTKLLATCTEIVTQKNVHSNIFGSTMVVESNLDDHTLEKTICIRKNNFSKETSLGEGRNLYEILKLNFKEIRKLDRDRQDILIRRAYHREILRWHTDTAGEFGDNEMVHAVIASYDILNDHKRRAEYHNKADYNEGWLSKSRWRSIVLPEFETKEQICRYRQWMALFLMSLCIGIGIGIGGVASGTLVAACMGGSVQSFMSTINCKNIEKGCDFEDWAKSLVIGFIAGAITVAVGAEITNGVSVIGSNAGLASGGGAVFFLAADAEKNFVYYVDVSMKQVFGHAVAGAIVGGVTATVFGVVAIVSSTNIAGPFAPSLRDGISLANFTKYALGNKGFEAVPGTVTGFVEERLDDEQENRPMSEHVTDRGKQFVKGVLLDVGNGLLSSTVGHITNQNNDERNSKVDRSDRRSHSKKFYGSAKPAHSSSILSTNSDIKTHSSSSGTVIHSSSSNSNTYAASSNKVTIPAISDRGKRSSITDRITNLASLKKGTNPSSSDRGFSIGKRKVNLVISDRGTHSSRSDIIAKPARSHRGTHSSSSGRIVHSDSSDSGTHSSSSDRSIHSGSSDRGTHFSSSDRSVYSASSINAASFEKDTKFANSCSRSDSVSNTDSECRVLDHELWLKWNKQTVKPKYNPHEPSKEMVYATKLSEPLIQLKCVSETKARFTFLSNKWFTKMIVKFKEKGYVHVKKTTENGTAIEVPMNAKDVKVYFQVMRFFKMWCDVKKWNRFKNKWYDEPHKFRYETPPEQRVFTLGGSLFYEGVINVTDERHDDVTDM